MKNSTKTLEKIEEFANVFVGNTDSNRLKRKEYSSSSSMSENVTAGLVSNIAKAPS